MIGSFGFIIILLDLIVCEIASRARTVHSVWCREPNLVCLQKKETKKCWIYTVFDRDSNKVNAGKNKKQVLHISSECGVVGGEQNRKKAEKNENITLPKTATPTTKGRLPLPEIAVVGPIRTDLLSPRGAVCKNLRATQLGQKLPSPRRRGAASACWSGN